MYRIYLLVLLSFALNLSAQPGTLDPTFATNGIFMATPKYQSENASHGAVQADGKILMAGHCEPVVGRYDFLVRRLNADGLVDGTFGNGGDVVINLGSVADNVRHVAVLPDGKILLAGKTGIAAGGYALVRLLPDGSPDQSFGTNGIVVDSFGIRLQLHSMAVSPQGDIVLAGGSDTLAGLNYNFFLARHTATGQRDQGFGNGGRMMFSSGYQREHLYSIALQADGYVLAAGIGASSAQKSVLVVYRFKPDGTPDTGFGNNGHFLYGNPQHDILGAAMLLRNDGTILAGGTEALNFNNAQVLVLRLTAAGVPDATFATAGKFLSDKTEIPFATCNMLVEQPDGRILAVGKTYDAGGLDDFMVMRLNEDGTLDAGFGGNGKVSTDLNNGKMDVAQGAFLQHGERLVVIGNTLNVGQVLGAVRYLTGLETGLASTDDQPSGFMLYPNPVRNHLHVHSLGKQGAATLVDIQGRMVMTSIVVPGTNTIDVSALPPGNYLFCLPDGKTTHMVKWVKW